MRKIFIALLFVASSFTYSEKASAQKKYPSIMWEITGKNLKKPSYLFGTMHVSSKIAFNLSDSFYNALKSVDAAAIEIDPLTWQDEYNNSIMNKIGPGVEHLLSDYASNDYISKNSFLFTESDMSFRIALAMDPAIINHFLYRNYQGVSDFEENTYIDMHIFQSAQKLKKKFYPLENFKESEELMLKGYREQAATIRKKKSRSTEVDLDEVKRSKSGFDNAEDAYRNGDLDLMDSLDHLNEYNEVFNEYFLYERNKIHANGIDKIIANGQTIFAAVGAAHLPGNRGVIELLRAKGYRLRPIFMGIKVSNQRDEINKIKIPVTFATQKADDNLFTVDVPGKLHNFKGSNIGLSDNQWVYADFSNGAYYMVTRVPTNNFLWGKTSDDVYKKIDSLLYENIPGKILERTPIINNGYKGFNIVNKTKKGDLQRYNIIVTPLELLVFKMSGFEEYVSGNEGNQFFNSIKINKPKNEWTYFSPKEAGYKILLPNNPIATESSFGGRYSRYSDNDNTQALEAYDEKSDVYLMIAKKNFTNYSFLEEDTFCLALANESLLSSALFSTPDSRIMAVQNGIPYIETKGIFYGNYNYTSRIYMIGTDYYAVIAKHKNKDSIVTAALNSFNYVPYKYGKSYNYKDSAMHFMVNSVLAPDSLNNIFIEIARLAKKTQEEEYRSSKKQEEPYHTANTKIVFKSDTTNEEIIVKCETFPKYYQLVDTASFWRNNIDELNESIRTEISRERNPFGNNLEEVKTYTSYLDFYVKEKAFTHTNNSTICNVVYSDTNSSQLIKAKFILAGNRLLTAYCIDNNLAEQSRAKKEFLDNFSPYLLDTVIAVTAPKTNIFFNDFYSSDSMLSKFARHNIQMVNFKETDIPALQNAIASLDYHNKEYFATKLSLIKALEGIKQSEPLAAAIENIYKTAGDTTTFQNAAILGLANCHNIKSYKTLAKIINDDPPIFENATDVSYLFASLSDSLQLTRNILPQILNLANLDDYKQRVYNLLTIMLDSSIISTKEYKSLYNKIFFDAKIALKKMQTADERMSVENSKDDEDVVSAMPSIDRIIRNTSNIKSISQFYNAGSGNTVSDDDIETYCNLLVPYYQKNNNAKLFFDKLLQFKSNSTKLTVATVLQNNKITVPDSVWLSIAKDEKTRIKFLNYAIESNRMNLFPKQFTQQQIIAKDILQQSSYSKKDSLEYLNVFLPVKLKNKSGNIYFFKYKSEEKDVDWKIAYCGLQPIDTNAVNASKAYTEFSFKVLKTNKTVEEQAAKIVKEEMYKSRKCSSNFYENSRSYDYRGY